VQTYLETMSALGAETFLMHGSLLGWWWNQKIMPWDSDVDVSISQPTLNYLADYYNMTVHRYQLPFDPDDPNSLTSASSASSSSSSPSSFSDDNTHSLGPSRDYLLDINPHCRNASTADRYNVIDARWIDVATGLYIDITTLRPHDDVAGVTATANNTSTSASTGDADDDRLLSIKDGHAYATTDIYPLRDSLFEGTPCRIPAAYARLLEREYGAHALTDTAYHGYCFDADASEWRRCPPKLLLPPPPLVALGRPFTGGDAGADAGGGDGIALPGGALPATTQTTTTTTTTSSLTTGSTSPAAAPLR